MRIVKNLLATAIASSLVATPVLANSQKLSVAAAQRDAAPVGQQEAVGGGKIIVTLLAIFAIIGGIIVFVKDNDEDLPTSA